jgi:hypothetical protein
VIPYDSDSEAVDIANDSDYALEAQYGRLTTRERPNSNEIPCHWKQLA